MWADERLQRLMAKCVDISADKAARRAPFAVEEDELRAEGWLGAWHGCCRYDATRGVQPFTFVAWYIRGYIQHHLRRLARERGCPAWRWEAHDYTELEVPLGDAAVSERALTVRDLDAETQMADAADGHWRQFYDKLTRHEQRIVQGLLDGETAAETAMALGSTGTSVGSTRSIIRRKFRRWLRGQRAQQLTEEARLA